MSFDIGKLNSATKYPSIPTYHALDPADGCLLPETVPFPENGQVLLTEKVDGAGCRIIFLDDGDYFIGSREQLLYADGDRIINPESGIVPTLKPIAKRLFNDDALPIAQATLLVYYIEVYGHKIGHGWKNYTTGNGYGFRLFDVAYIPNDVLGESPEHIAGWRERSEQDWFPEEKLLTESRLRDLPLVPRIASLSAAELPVSIPGMSKLIDVYSASRVKMDSAGRGIAEGLVLRTPDRSVIAKARQQSYQRTLRMQGNPA